MNAINTLVVFYSHTGNTRRLASDIASRLAADLEEIEEVKPRRGMWLFRWFTELFLGRRVRLKPAEKHPSAYDLLVIGTPVWVTLPPPVATYLQQQRQALNRVAFFFTHVESGAEGVFRRMSELSRTHPLATLEVTEAELEEGRYAEKLDAFIGALTRPAGG